MCGDVACEGVAYGGVACGGVASAYGAVVASVFSFTFNMYLFIPL